MLLLDQTFSFEKLINSLTKVKQAYVISSCQVVACQLLSDSYHQPVNLHNLCRLAIKKIIDLFLIFEFCFLEFL